MTETVATAQRDPLVSVNAGMELAERRKLRAVAEAARSGRTQRDIAAKLNVSQVAVHKMLVKAQHTRDLFTQTPREIALRYGAGEITRDELLDALANVQWTATQILEPDNPLTEQIVPGNWVELERAVLDGFVTYEDYDAVSARLAQ